MFAAILGIITGLGGPLINLGNKITDLQIKKAEAKSNEEIKRIDASLEEAHDRKAVLVAEAGHRIAGALNASMRLVLAAGAAGVLLKLMLWDKVVGSFVGCSGILGKDPSCYSFRTDPLDSNQWAVITAVIGFYFLYDIAARFRK